MAGISYKQVDVFASEPFQGNPVAVILDAANLSAEQMQQIANWMNLSETTFVVPPTDTGADYRVRIFTPHAELPFAGHPTIGTAFALLEAGLVRAKDGHLIQQCEAGLIRLTTTTVADDEQWIAFDLPSPKMLAADFQIENIEASLRIKLPPEATPQVIDVGPRWLVVQLSDAASVLAVQPDFSYMKVHNAKYALVGITIFGEYAQGSHARIEARSFAPSHGVNEDPVCGSGVGCVGVFIRNSRQIEHFGKSFLVTQGIKMGRSGMLRLTLSEATVQVGGRSITCIDGKILP
jgi:PhzF family phenazine biosynthesis protein